MGKCFILVIETTLCLIPLTLIRCRNSTFLHHASHFIAELFAPGKGIFLLAII